ncbi:hypothetical protein FD755_017789 [Muntiacus reevesi]|uniref:G-protein coupled receptors family 1 profile domain-containing protein n=1 Tax=Muntiacus reevesi TaxID=9886 RepID=A0A5N3XE50_MUNRE|nr:hypothetical protein FD755_017789 [Muntiacus reevesi]
MGEGNQTFVLEFTLLGLSQDPKIQIWLFCVFLIIYLLSVFGNLLIIILIQTDPRLHTPMYFFLKNLSFADLCFSTGIVPQVLVHFLVKQKTASVAGCSLQIVVFLLAGCTECAPLAMMSYDRYVATPTVMKWPSFQWVIVLLAPVSLILASYWHIISTVIRMQSGEGRLKVFSTCSSHLTVVALYYGSGIFAYMRPNSKTMNERDKVISLFYSVMTSMLNPIIYSLRNKDVKGALSKLAGR